MKKLANLSAIDIAAPTLIIFASLALAAYWAFLVPIFQSPDEDLHTDYVFNLYSHGQLTRDKTLPTTIISHPYVSYLLVATDGQTIKRNPFIKMPANYGTKQFYELLDRNAPNKSLAKQITTNPLLTHVYPIGYYALTAAWLSLLSHFSDSLSFLFFAARLFSVFLLGIGLIMSYLVMLELRTPKIQSLLILAIIGFFPLTAFVGSYIQPHNLAFALISTSFYSALLWRNKPNEKLLYFLAIALSALLLTKYQFFLCASVAIASMIMAKTNLLRATLTDKFRILSIIFVPSIIAGIIQLFVYSYCNKPFIYKEHAYWLPVYINAGNPITPNLAGLLKLISSSLDYAYTNMYCTTGTTFSSFWGLFGWLDTPLIIFNLQLNNVIRYFIQIVSFVVFICTLASIWYVAKIAYQLITKKHIRKAIYILCANPIINTYFLFTILIILLTIIEYPSFIPQGRHWFPLILPVVLTTIIFTFRVVPNRRRRQQLSMLIGGCWLLYAVIGSYYAPGCIAKRYFYKEQQKIVNPNLLTPSTTYVPCSIDIFRPAEAEPSIDFRSDPDVDVPSGSILLVNGWTFDSRTGLPASAVLFYENNKLMQQATSGLESLEALKKIKNNDYRYTGFGALISTKDLAYGPHSISIKVVSSDNHFLYQTNTLLKFVVVHSKD